MAPRFQRLVHAYSWHAILTNISLPVIGNGVVDSTTIRRHLQ